MRHCRRLRRNVPAQGAWAPESRLREASALRGLLLLLGFALLFQRLFRLLLLGLLLVQALGHGVLLIGGGPVSNAGSGAIMPRRRRFCHGAKQSTMPACPRPSVPCPC